MRLHVVVILLLAAFSCGAQAKKVVDRSLAQANKVVDRSLAQANKVVDRSLAQVPLESRLAQLPLGSLGREYPNKPEHVLAGPADILGPRQLHPAFFGSYDWHSSVHGHWTLVRLLRRYPNLAEASQIRQLLDLHLTEDNLRIELKYFQSAQRQSFERPYGWAWLLKLAEELHEFDDPDARRWNSALQPLAQEISQRYQQFFPKQLYPIRSGVHSETAFGLSFALDYAKTVGDAGLTQVLKERSLAYFEKDCNYPADWEPGGDCFLSSALCEADLMRRVLDPEQFAPWLHKFLPNLAESRPVSLFTPAQVVDRSDPKLVHLDGLNLSRAWAFQALARALPPDDPARLPLQQAARQHREAGLEHVASGDYAGEHWLATFATYLITESE